MYIDINTLFTFEVSKSDDQSILAAIVRRFMWQLCAWDRVDICMTFHMRAFDFFIPLHIDLIIFKIARL
jgi:hypothetical protein